MFQRWLRLPLLVCCLTASPALVRAQDFPSRAIKIIVPNPPGGAGDISARLIGQKLSEVFHQPVVVENQPGASGSIGDEHAQARRARRLHHRCRHLAVADHRPASRTRRRPSISPRTSRRSPRSPTTRRACWSIRRSRRRRWPSSSHMRARKPGKLTYGSAGIGTALHLYGEVLNKVAGIKWCNVPYRGVTPAFNDLLGGHVPVAIVSLATALQHLGRGKVRLLTVFDTKRYAKAPDVPTITEVLPDYMPGRTWVGFLAPPDLPSAITDAAPCRDRAHPQIDRGRAISSTKRARRHCQQPLRVRRDDPRRTRRSGMRRP